MSSHRHSRRRQLALGVALLGCPLTAATVAQGAIVSIDVSTFNGVNAGMTYNQSRRTISSFVFGGHLVIFFDTNYIGLDTEYAGSLFHFATNGPYASPRNFGANADISAWAGAWDGRVYYTAFRYGSLSPNFGPGSFMGFRFGDGTNWNYGWIEVTWNWTGNPQTSTFQILGAAYESQVNTAILAGALAPPAIPLPGAAGLAACGLLGRSRRRRR